MTIAEFVRQQRKRYKLTQRDLADRAGVGIRVIRELQVGRALREYSDVPGLDTVRFFELAIYCFLTGNSDMHLKNFSLIRQKDGHYELAPAYDLVPVQIILPEDKEELALTLGGKKSKFERADFERFGVTLQLSDKQIAKAISRISATVSQYLTESLDSSFLPNEMKNAVSDLITNRIARIQC